MSTYLVSAEVTASWALGWDAFVAIGTLLLALVTVFLVRRTSALARSSDAEIRAQWRPLILPALDLSWEPSLVYEEEPGSLEVRIQNAGRGPAIHIRTQMVPDGVSPENWSLGALAAGDKQSLIFRVAKPNSATQLRFAYRDLAERTYSTSITIEVVDGNLRFYDVHLFENRNITTLGDAVYPQLGLGDVSPRVRPDVRARLRMIRRSVRGDFQEYE
jgi:hypothetical protein